MVVVVLLSVGKVIMLLTEEGSSLLYFYFYFYFYFYNFY